MIRTPLATGLRSLSAIVIFFLFLTLPARQSASAETDQSEVSEKYTYWIELTSLSKDNDSGALESGQVTTVPHHPQKIYIPFFAINRGKFEIPLRAWANDPAKKALSLLEKVYLDRNLTAENNVIDLVGSFPKTASDSPDDAMNGFRHTVYGQMPSTGLIKAEFQVTREPNRFKTQMEADLAFFDRKFISLYVPDFEDSAGPLGLITTAGQRAISFLVDLVFLVDRLFVKSKNFITPGYLERTSQPSSAFYKDYLEYQRGSLTEDQLIQRLPHVAMIGDSLAKNAYVSSILSMFWRVRTEHQGNWFLDTDKSPDSINSIYERLEELTPLVAVEHSGAGANVDSGKSGDTFFQMLSKTRNFSQQADEILEQERFSDLLLIWIGHNNLNWAAPLGPDERRSPDMPLLRRLWRFRKYYARQLERLVDRAKKEKHKTAIVVFGVVNFEAFFEARRAAGLLKEKNPELYPHFETGYQIYLSMRPEYQNNMIRLALMMNAELRDLVDELNQELKSYPNVRLEYSDALATTDLSSVELVHPVDAWHPSVKGHNVLAESAFRALSPSLRFLEIRPK